MPSTDSNSARFTLRILGLPLRGRVMLSPPVAATAVDADADADAVVSGERATETKGTLVLLRNSWADLSLPLTFSLQPDADETSVHDPERAKRIKDGWISFGYRALWCLGCIGVIYVSYLVCLYVKWNGPYNGDDGRGYVSMRCGDVCQYEMPAWWYKSVEFTRSESHDAFLLMDKSHTIPATFTKNMTLNMERGRWGDNRQVLVKLLQRGGEDFTFDVNLTKATEPFARVTIDMFNPDTNADIFQLTIKESGRYEAHVPEYNLVNGPVWTHLRFTLGPYMTEAATAQISASGETRKYNVSAALASCPAEMRTPISRPCNFNAPSPFHSSLVVFQQIEGPVDSGSSWVYLDLRPRIAAIISQYVPMGLISLAALVTLAFVLWNRRTPVEAWREKRVKKDVGTDEEREPMLGEDV
ncbi:hypothetical protein HK101_002003 [Irineochytrium annulatum]|nr:hypothetical protein HK101_002003 [Irineochytrium annulatum]